MARLTRKNIKVFAGNATNNGVFGSLQANNPVTTNDVEQLQSLSAWGDGWDAATETSEDLPPLEEIQGVEYVTTYQQAYIMQEGIPEWAATVTYYKGCLAKEVTSTGFRIYNSLTDDNTGNLLSDTSNWKKVMDSDDLYAFDNTVVHKAGSETISGEKTFSVSPQVPTATAGDSSSNAASTEFVTTVASSLQTQVNTKANASDVVTLAGAQTISGQKTFSSVAYGTASDANGSIVTTVNKSKAANGYFQLGNGMIINWGTQKHSSAAITITFAKAFTSTNYAVTAILNTSSSSTTERYCPIVYSKTTTNCVIWIKGTDGNISWHAIGY
jgi:hypothetical protein